MRRTILLAILFLTFCKGEPAQVATTATEATTTQATVTEAGTLATVEPPVELTTQPAVETAQTATQPAPAKVDKKPVTAKPAVAKPAAPVTTTATATTEPAKPAAPAPVVNKPAPAPEPKPEPAPVTTTTAAPDPAPAKPVSTTPAKLPKTHTVNKDGAMHAPGAESAETKCVACHGKGLDGGRVGVSCLRCHKKNW